MRECGIHVVDSPAEKKSKSFRIVRYFKLKDKGLTFVGLFLETKLKKYICSLFKNSFFTALIVTNRNDWCR
jgi:hypothetical protein